MQNEIKEALRKAEMNVLRLRKQNSRYIVISIIAGVMATLLSGSTAFLGPLMGGGTGGWKLTCGVVAVFSATATVFTGLHKQFSISERLAKALECVGKLRSIDFSFSNSPSENEKSDLIKEYKKVIELYNEFLI